MNEMRLRFCFYKSNYLNVVYKGRERTLLYQAEHHMLVIIYLCFW